MGEVRLTAEQEAAYIKAKGVFCPLCGSEDIWHESLDASSDWHADRVGCKSCKATWINVYTLSAIEDVERESRAKRASRSLFLVPPSHRRPDG